MHVNSVWLILLAIQACSYYIIASILLSSDPQAPRSVTSFCTVIVWQAPRRAYGIISGYDVMFVDPESGEGGTVITKERDQLFHKVEQGNMQNGMLVQVNNLLRLV